MILEESEYTPEKISSKYVVTNNRVFFFYIHILLRLITL